MFRISLILIFAFTLNLQVRANSDLPGSRYIDLFPKLDIGIEKTQVWDIEQGINGFIFLATNEGLGVFDGSRWSLYGGESSLIIRSLFYCEMTNAVYSGSVNEFGKWEQNRFGEFEYTTIFRSTESQINQEFWRTGSPTDSEKIYFQSDHAIYVLNKNSGEMQSVRAEQNFRYMHIVKNSVLVQDGNRLMMVGPDNTLSAIGEVDDRIVRILAAPDDKWYVVLEYEGLFEGSADMGLRPLNEQTNMVLGNAKIFSAALFDANRFLVGTTRNGLYEIDTEGNIIAIINEDSGLTSTSVLSVDRDSKGDVWLGLDVGVARIDNSSGERYLLGHSKLGTIQAVKEFNQQIFLGSNKGLFLLKDNNSFELIENTLGPVWGIYQINDELIFTHDVGIFAYRDGKAVRVKEGGSTSLARIPGQGNYYVSGDYHGLSLLEMNGGQLKFVGRIDHYGGRVRHLLIDKYGYIWIKIDRTGFVRLTLSENKMSVIDVKHFVMRNGTTNPLVSLLKIDNEPVFYSDGDAYLFDIGSDELLLSDYYTGLVQGFGPDLVNVVQSGNNFFYQTGRDIGIIKRNGNQLERVSGLFSKIYNKRITQGFAAFNDSTFALGFQNGVGFFRYQERPIERLSVRKIEALGVGTPILYDHTQKEFVVPFNQRFMRIYPTNVSENNLIQYRMLGYDTIWQTVQVEDYLELTYLTTGEYNFQIRNMDQSGSDYSSISIRIMRPWYFCNWMLTLYSMLILVLFLLIRRYYRKKSVKEHKRLAEEIKLKQKERIEKLEKENLRIEIREKDKRLATITMAGLQKKSLLTSLREKFNHINETADTTNYKSGIRSVIQLLDKQLENSEEWDLLEEYYNNIYDGLLDRLKIQYPMLTTADMKLCVYIKLKLNNKEMADLLGISPRSVEMARYRLRKKMDLDPHDDFSSVLS